MGGLCKHGANPFIEHYFKDCIYDSRDLFGFCLGMGSIFCWMVAQVPQLIKNYRDKTADALSPVFLAEWLLGDTFNLVGALLKGDQPNTIVLTAQYFICMDCVLLLQYLYYTSLAKRRERTYVMIRRREQQQQQQHRDRHGGHHHHHHHHSAHHNASRMRVAAAAATGIAATTVLVLSTGRFQFNMAASGTIQHHTRQLLSTAIEQRVGTVLGYTSSVLYLSSRAFQIYKNFTRRSVKGLALSMFFCAITANLLYGSAAITRSRSREEFMSSLPWIIGSLGTVCLDMTILLQGFKYGDGGGSSGGEGKHSSDEEEHLLSASERGVGEEVVSGGVGGSSSTGYIE